MRLLLRGGKGKETDRKKGERKGGKSCLVGIGGIDATGHTQIVYYVV